MNAELIRALGPSALTPNVPDEARIILASDQAFREAATVAARKRYVEMNRRQGEIARDLQTVERKTAEGIGQHYMRIDQELFFQMRALYGEDCWADGEFVEAFHRDNPQCRVKTTRGTKGQELLRK